MIIKFDHITFVIEPSDFKTTDQNLRDLEYEMKFSEKDKPNLPNKQCYFTYKQNLHDLYYYEHINKLPVEVIAYSEVTNNKCPFSFDFENDKFQIYSNSLDLFQIVLKKDVSNPEFNNFIDIKGILDKKPIILELKDAKSNEIEWNLDNAGFCCPTFIVNNLEKYKKYLENKNLKCSEINKININNTDLSVFFVEGQNKELVEIISYN